jgi:hypothetical protein
MHAVPGIVGGATNKQLRCLGWGCKSKLFEALYLIPECRVTGPLYKTKLHADVDKHGFSEELRRTPGPPKSGTVLGHDIFWQELGGSNKRRFLML